MSAEPTTKKKKANSVVKFIATPTTTNTAAAGERSVFTLVVKVNHKAGKPTTTAGTA